MIQFFSRVVLCICTVVLTCTCAFGATYYLATTAGTDSNSCTAAQSSATPKKSFGAAWGCLSAGDTLVVANGTYTSASPPSGKSGAAGNMIMVRAASDGGAIISGGLTLANNSYLEFQGFKITSTGYPLDAHSAGAGLVTHHITFRRCGFNTSSTSEYGGISVSDGTHHLLFEDFWVWGGGRYAMSFYGGDGGSPPNTTCDYNTLRRGVIRQGPADSSPGNPEAGLALYYSSYNTIENVIVLDGNQNSDSSNAAFYLTSHAPVTGSTGSNNNNFYGCMAINNTGTGYYMDFSNDGGTGSNNGIYNSVFWNNQNGIQLLSPGGSGNIVDHCTVGVTSQYETLWNSVANTTATNSIFTKAKTYGVKNVASFSAQHHNDLFDNSLGAYSGTSAGTGSITTNPLLLYPVRIETNSPCKNAGEAGDIGGNVLKCYVDGAETTDNLWPWQYESRIRQEMCTDASISTGFCSAFSRDGSPQTLTKYIWEYLGNQIPSEVYGAESDTTAPIVTAFTIPSTASSLTVDITTFTATDAVGVTGYKLTESATAPGAGDAGWTGTAPTYYTFATAGSKTLYAWAKDAAGNVSTSLNDSVTITLPDTTAPSVSIDTTDPSNISTDTLAISGSASDAVGVTSCKWRIGSAPDETHGTALSGTTSWSGTVTGFSSGANTLYAGCTDAAGNWGSDSMVVNYTPPSSFRVGPVGGALSGGTIQ